MRLGIMYIGKGGGICQYTYELAKAICSKTELVLFIASQNFMLADFKALPCKVHVIDVKRGYKSLFASTIIGGEAKRIAFEILKDTPDIILDTGSSSWCVTIMKWLSGKVPTAAVIHDVYPHPNIRHIKDALPEILCPLSADAVVLLSDLANEQALRRYPEKTRIKSKHGIIHLPENIDIDTISANRKKLLFFGNIDPYKGLDYLIEAFSIAKRTAADISLTIAGNGEISKNMMRKIESNDIRLINRYIQDDEVSDLFSSHGLLVLPYTSATQSGVAAAALANALPAIATNTGALPEQIIDRVNGKIVPPKDSQALAHAILDIMHDEEIFKQMAKESLRLGQNDYSWERIAQFLINDLNDLVSRRRQ